MLYNSKIKYPITINALIFSLPFLFYYYSSFPENNPYRLLLFISGIIDTSFTLFPYFRNFYESYTMNKIRFNFAILVWMVGLALWCSLVFEIILEVFSNPNPINFFLILHTYCKCISTFIYMDWLEALYDSNRSKLKIHPSLMTLIEPKNINKENECSVCLLLLSTDTVVELPCKHRYHKKCIEFNIDKCCLCRAPLKTISGDQNPTENPINLDIDRIQSQI